ncbi:putative disease resistance protein RGA3 [Vitis vinifera]|uniref:Putative disease resistance protein RGA3 n=1 Tax=Vitis vinifera TaxID=29760 RepID=A0A438GI28_VITVI|nr:putative disease resistance protein RGA3 [Vitis vinifera]
MGDNSPISLEGLEQNQSWDLFSKIAFREGQENLHPEILEIGEEIAKMCKGVPLIIKTLAMILQSKREQGEWLSIRNNKNLLSLGEENRNVLSVLKLSYDNLPTHLRQCFSYCAVFPKDYEIEKKSLVQLWIAQGYIQSSNDNNEQPEDIGDRYFEELLSRSLLEKAENNPFTNTLRYKMHDLMHDLAQSIIRSEILILRNDITNISKEIRHVSLFNEVNLKIKDLKGKPIRTFIVGNGYWKKDKSFVSLVSPGHWKKDSSAISEVLPSFKSLRVLSVDNLPIKKVSMWVDKLSHLRYLDLSDRGFEALPNAITRLKNLQTLKLNECWSLKRFPKDTRKLINLRHLENDGCANLTHMPHGIGELTLLQSLPLFVVGEERELSRDHTIGSLIELKRLNQLRGGLLIKNLQNARVSEGEILKEKECLESLRLEWDQEGNCDVDDELVMKGLQPHRNLKELYIGGYRGEMFPSWMMNNSLLPNLIKIDIRGCSRCQILPPFSQLPALQSLELWDMEEVEGVKEGSSTTNAEFFPALQFLKLNKMPKLKGLWRIGSGAEQGLSFPHLSELEIEECSKLTSFELHSSPSLSTSKIKKCPDFTSFKLHSLLVFLL